MIATRIQLAMILTLALVGCSPDDAADRAGASPDDRPRASESGTTRQRVDDSSRGVTPAPGLASEAEAQGPGAPSVSFEHRSARGLIESLQSLPLPDDGSLGTQADTLLRELRKRGAEAVLSIRDFLLDSADSGAVSPGLRRALLDVLLGLRVPEVKSAALELLAAGPPAFEVWQLGRYLEAAAPGEYSESILAMAEQALLEAESPLKLPGEFFVFLGSLGTTDTALLLAGLPGHQEAYGSLGLAAVPFQGGIPLLEQDARTFERGRDTVQGRLAIQLLAQEAPRSPAAAAALIELAEQGAIPADLWPYLLDIVAGNWELTPTEPPAELLVGSHTYYHPDGNQVIFRALRHPDERDDGFDAQRLFLLDRLQPFAPPDLVPGTGG